MLMALEDNNTVTIISIRTTNFGWARPNRVFSRAMFKKIAAGHPKFGAEREVRASSGGLAHRVAFKRSARFKKPFLQKKKLPKTVLGRLEAGFPLV